MREILGVGLLVSLLLLAGCGGSQSPQPTYQDIMKQSGYIRVDIVTGSSFWGEGANGYIKKDEYDKYLKGELNGRLEVLHPYTEGQSVIVNTDAIKTLEKY